MTRVTAISSMLMIPLFPCFLWILLPSFLVSMGQHRPPMMVVAAWSYSHSQHSPTQSKSTTTRNAMMVPSSASEQDNPNANNIRRKLLHSVAVSSAALLLSPVFPSQAAAEAETKIQQPYQRQKDKIAYSIQIPIQFKETQKPLKTHLDEINFVSEDVKGYQYGITVDPVRINSLKEFGTPEEVAARVVTAEVNRDGVFEVTLLADPYEVDGAYILQYLSVGKRGNKHYYNKIFISDDGATSSTAAAAAAAGPTTNLLYVLTAQVKQDDYESQKAELERVVASFQLSS